VSEVTETCKAQDLRSQGAKVPAPPRKERTHSVWLVQNVIAPYRVRLFEEIAKSAEFDFSVVLTAARCKHRPHWNLASDRMPFRVLTMRGMNLVSSGDSSFSVSFGLGPALMRGRPDVVICGGFSLSTVIVFLYARLFKKKYVIWSEGTAVTERWRRVGAVRRCVRRVLAAHADAFLDAGTLSREYLKTLCSNRSRAPFFRSYNCVEASSFASSASGGVEPAVKEDEDCRQILFVGQLTERKGVPMLLETCKAVARAAHVPVRLTLVGAGLLRDYVERFRQTAEPLRVDLRGQVSYAEVARYYRACDVFVLLSLADCNPLVLFEALHTGVPIVCSDRAGNAIDFVEHGANGYIVDPEDRDGIVRCIADVLDWDAQARSRCARVSRQNVSKANYRDAARAFVEACKAVLRKTPEPASVGV
jgi:glycosyltransferase involved in cell wall biosynthesis